MSEFFFIPYALDEQGNLNSPKLALKSVKYFCPGCKKPVILRQFKTRNKDHFAHKISNDCNQESIIHKTAKLLILKVINEWKSGNGNPPEIRRPCQICMKERIIQAVPDKVDSALIEHKLADGFKPDVVLLSREEPAAAVEIKVTHAVDEFKANKLSIPFIELDGKKVIENPLIWKAIQNTFKPMICGECKSNYKMFIDKVNDIANRNNIELPKAYYRYGLHNCSKWKCKCEMIVYTWPNNGVWSSPLKIKPPRTLQFRFSPAGSPAIPVGHKCWVNTCPKCNSIQDDLSSKPEGAFFGTNVVEDSPDAFHKDMMSIANHYFDMLARSKSKP